MSTPLRLRVTSGRPDDAELAAVVAVLLGAATGDGAGPVAGRRRSPWGDPATLLRRPAPPTPGGWAAPRP